MNKFIISTDTCVDHYKSYLKQNHVYYIIMNRICNGKVIGEFYDSPEEFRSFYDSLIKGELPTTSQLNPFEMKEHFEEVLKSEPCGDIIHLPLSSGLSETYENARIAAEELNKTLTGRKIYIVDSLSASLGIGMLVDRLIEMRNDGTDALNAIKKIEDIRDRQQVWTIVGNLFHLKRGGRLSGFKAAVGSLLKLKPIMIIDSKGKLTVEKTIKGERKAVEYLVSKFRELGVNAGIDYSQHPVYILHSFNEELFAQLEKALREQFPNINIKKGLVGPVIGTHVGEGLIGIIFEGCRRLNI